MYVRPTSTRLLRGTLTPAMRANSVDPYPWRCLWRGFWQMTATAPWRRMILHFSHIGFTDGRTFMVPFQEFGPVTRSGCRGSSRCYVTDGAHAGALRTRGQLKIAKRVRRRLDPNDSRTSAVRPWPRASDERVADAVDR